MFNNYAIVQGVDHVVPVDMYLPGCPPRPEMLIDAILKLHDKIMHEPLGPKRAKNAGRARRREPCRRIERAREALPDERRHDAGDGRSSEDAAEIAERAADPAGSGVRRRGRRAAARHVRRARLRRHLRLRRPACAEPLRRAPRRGPTAATSTRSPTRSTLAVPRAVGEAVDGRRRPRRAHVLRRAASTCSALVQALRDDPALRFELLSSVSGVDYPTDAGRGCTPSTS